MVASHVQSLNVDVCFDQEAQVSSEQSIQSLFSQWDGHSSLSPALGRQGGVAVLFSRNFLGEICSWKRDSEGRVVRVLVSLGGLSCNLVSVYALTSRSERSAFFFLFINCSFLVVKLFLVVI